MPFVLDTSFLVDLERGHEGALALLHEIASERTPNLIPTIVVTEYLAGSTEPGADVEALGAAGEIQAFDLDDAIAAAAVVRETSAAGRFPGWNDALIAGFARNRDSIIVTANPKHFPGARTRTY